MAYWQPAQSKGMRPKKMLPVYQVRRPEPLPVNSIRVSIREVLDGLATVSGWEAHYECDRNTQYDDPDQEYQRCDENYLKTITAKITGRETTSGRRITIGHMKAVFVKENMAGHRMHGHKGAKDLKKMMDEYSESLRMLKQTIHGKGLVNTIIGFGNGWGDLPLVEHIRLEPRYRGYGIGLLAVKMFRDHVGKASEGWNQEGVMIVDASGLDSDLEPGHSRRELQIRMFRHWQLIGLKPIVSEFERKRGKQCNFVGNWQTIYGFPWDMATLVPHLFTANCDTANVRPTTPERRSSLEEIYALVNSAQKRARMHRAFGED